MGKLVLFLADGTTMDVPLDKERITIGRRADNDVCLPYPAVSGEHAAVVTILADSFLEDLGSTNGTLVNGRPVAMHFLTDHDQIDIGRQRFTYMSDNAAKVDPLPPDLVRNQLRGLTEKVEPARPVPNVAVPRGSAGRPHSGARGAPPLADLERDASAPLIAAGSGPELPAQPAWGAAPLARRGERSRPMVQAPARLDAPISVSAPVRGIPRETSPRITQVAEAEAAPPAPRVRSGPSVRVLSGPSLGRSVPFPNQELSVGRVGVQVAILRKVAEGYRLGPLEGSEPPRINGAPVGPAGSPLHPGDTFEVAGVRLELSVDS